MQKGRREWQRVVKAMRPKVEASKWTNRVSSLRVLPRNANSCYTLEDNEAAGQVAVGMRSVQECYLVQQ